MNDNQLEQKESNNVDGLVSLPLVVSKLDGELIGDVELKNGGEDLYKKATPKERANIRLEIALDASKQFGCDCIVLESENK